MCVTYTQNEFCARGECLSLLLSLTLLRTICQCQSNAIIFISFHNAPFTLQSGNSVPASSLYFENGWIHSLTAAIAAENLAD